MTSKREILVSGAYPVFFASLTVLIWFGTTLNSPIYGTVYHILPGIITLTLAVCCAGLFYDKLKKYHKQKTINSASIEH